MSNKIKRYALRAVISVWIIYMAIASFGRHHDYFQLVGGILIGLVVFGAGRWDMELGAIAPTREQQGNLEETFSVEGEDLNGRWSLVGAAEAGRELNPCATLGAATALRDEFNEAKKSDARFAWRNFRIVKTTRELI